MDEDLKPITEHVSSVLGDGEARLYEQVNVSFHWLLATLFAANGGALVTLLGRDVVASTLPLAFFAGGIVASILMGLANAIYATKSLLTLTDLKMTFVAFAAEQASFEELQGKIAALEGFKLMKWAMYVAGIVSLALLIGGMIAFACTYVQA